MVALPDRDAGTVRGHVQQVHRPGHGGQVDRRDAGGDVARADRGQVERRHAAVLVADDAAGATSRSIARAETPGAGMVEIRRPRPEVVRADLGAGRDMQPLAGAVVCGRPGRVRRGSTTEATTGTPRSLVALTSSSPQSTSPSAIAYLARCGWVHS